jgi:Ca2+-binding EF-hand superfamily protein
VNDNDGSSSGRKIESSRDGVGIAPSFTVGQGKVIAGLDQGLIGLCKGSSAYIIVPPNLAYGRMGKPEQGVMSNTILQYDVEVLDIQPPVPNDFVKIDSNKDWEISIDEAREYFEKLGQMVNLDTLWNDEDTNGDGYISWEEFKGPKGSDPPPKIPPKQTKKKAKQQQDHHQQSKQGSGANNIANIAQRMDTDKDGLISKAELSAVFEEAGSKMTEEFWAESDPDGDGFITFDEFLGSSNENNRALEKEDEL